MSLIIGCAALVIVLFAFLYEWRVALISCMAMPLSLVAAGLVLYLHGDDDQHDDLAGFVIALGDIVDDAIIDIENVVRRLREQRKEGGNTSDGADHSRSVARSAQRHRLRHADRSLRDHAGVLHEGCPAHSSSRWPSPMRWPFWCRWSSP